MCTLLEKNPSTGIRFKQVILIGRLDIQPVQLIYTDARAARARAARAKKTHQPSNTIIYYGSESIAPYLSTEHYSSYGRTMYGAVEHSCTRVQHYLRITDLYSIISI